MTLNFSRCPVIPPNPSEDNFASSIRFANGYVVNRIPGKNADALSNSQDSFDYKRDRDDTGGSCELVSNDILDLLPSDPFGMDTSTTLTALTGWLENLEVGANGFRRDEIGGRNGDCHLAAGLDVLWNTAVRFQGEPATSVVEESDIVVSSDGWVKNKEPCDGLCDAGSVLVSSVDGFLTVAHNEETRVTNCQPNELHSGEGSCSDGGEDPHDALLFALHCLGVQDLLSVERVCRSLRDAVETDSLLWRRIHIDYPLNEKITDDLLLKLTSRSEGNLQCLSLVGCPRITDDGLKRVLESNPKMTKLSVPGCTRLTVEGIVNNLKAFNSSGKSGIKILRIGGLYGVMHKHFEELKRLLGRENHLQLNACKPRLYHIEQLHTSCDEDHALDIEMCPRCQNFRLVYDCPLESCQGKQYANEFCRACILCISRCFWCGRCIVDTEYEETFCLDLLCANCCRNLLIERQEENGACSRNTFFHQETQYHLRFYG